MIYQLFKKRHSNFPNSFTPAMQEREESMEIVVEYTPPSTKNLQRLSKCKSRGRCPFSYLLYKASKYTG